MSKVNWYSFGWHQDLEDNAIHYNDYSNDCYDDCYDDDDEYEDCGDDFFND